ncbi:MAG: cation-translocating P-type ATPase [Thermoproteota archaeon]|nr:cation-translocating P-type ATPase [Thermoproteota archaeon]
MSCIAMSGACEFEPNQSRQQDDDEEPENMKLEILRLAGMATIIVLIGWMHLLQPTWLGNVVVIISVLVGGYPIFKESFFALRKGRVNMELSMVIAIVASLVLYQFLPAIVITFFALLSEFIEGYIVEKGRKNIKLLYNLSPRKAIIKRNNKNGDEESVTITTLETPIDEVRLGDIVIVRGGDTIPVDGHILRGASTVDQSSITGESAPIEKSVGDSAFAGTINLTHQLEIICEKLYNDTTFAKIIRLVEEAEASKAPIQKLSDKLATRLIQFAIGLSVLTFIVTHNVVSTLSVIVVAGACGLAVGTPIALLATNGKLSRRGIIVKGGLQIENLNSAGTIVFDKTGTLTSGKPGVSQVVSFDPRIDPIRILEYAAIAEKNVNHPLAKAIVARAREKKIEMNLDNSNNQSRIDISSDNNENIIKVGRGVTVFHDSRRIAVGNMKFMEDETNLTGSYTGGDSSASLRPGFSLLQNRRQHQYLANDDGNFGRTLQTTANENDNHKLFSSTTAFVSLDRQIIGAVLLEDKLRQETKEAISKIKAMSIHVVMLTGDNENIAKRIANEAGIEEYHANLLPEDKVSIIEEIVKKQKKGERKKEAVIMVGDGINDAPALAKADVGIAMGRSGTDVAIETADVVLMTEDLTKIPYLLKTSRQSLFAIKQNFFGTLFVDGLGFILAFVGVINPLLAAIIHVSSELVFMTNSARLIIDSNGGQTKL